MIINEVKEEYVCDLLDRGERIDGRSFLSYRPISVEKNVIENAEGSAIAKIGDTQVLAGIKIDLLDPFKDRPNEGVIMFNAEFAPVANPEFYAGPPNEHSVELARVVDRGIRSAETIDLKALAIEGSPKVFGVFVDLYVLDHSGNLIDTAALAAMAALRCTRMPKFEGDKIIREKGMGKLSLKNDVVTTTIEKINGKILVDANDEEEISSQGRLTFATCADELLCAGQKAGRAGFTKDEILQTIDLCFEKRKELVKYL